MIGLRKNFRGGFLLAVAAGCGALVAVINPYAMARFLALTRLPTPLVAFLWVIDAALVGLAVVIVRRRHDRQLQQNVALLGVTLALMLVVAEAALRLVDFRPGALALFRPDPLGRGAFRLKPNLALKTSMAGRAITFRSNARGMRWRDVRDDVLPPAKRIAFVGDSFTFGLWADDASSSFVGVSDSLLAPRGFEALNFGVPGYGLAEIERIVLDDVLRFKPAYVVLSLYTGNDLLDTFLGLPRYVVSRSGILDTDWDYIEDRIPSEFHGKRDPDPLVTRLYLYSVVRAAAKSMWPRAAESTGRFADTAQVDRSYSSNVFWSRRDYPPFADTALTLSLAALARIADAAGRVGARLVLVAIPSVEQIHLPAAFGPEYDIRRPQLFLERYARERGIPYLDLMPTLSANAAAGTEPYVRHEGHFRNEGHRIAGVAIAALIDSIVLRSSPAASHAR